MALDIGQYFEPCRFGRPECESAVRAPAVVVLDVDAQDSFEMAAAEDQERVDTLRSDGADETLSVGIRLRRSNRRVDYPDSFRCGTLRRTKR